VQDKRLERMRVSCILRILLQVFPDELCHESFLEIPTALAHLACTDALAWLHDLVEYIL